MFAGGISLIVIFKSAGFVMGPLHPAGGGGPPPGGLPPGAKALGPLHDTEPIEHKVNRNKYIEAVIRFIVPPLNGEYQTTLESKPAFLWGGKKG
jgi:hypothetical protein